MIITMWPSFGINEIVHQIIAYRIACHIVLNNKISITSISPKLHERSYHANCTRSRPIPEVKLRRAQLVVRCVSTCEAWVLFVLFSPPLNYTVIYFLRNYLTTNILYYAQPRFNNWNRYWFRMLFIGIESNALYIGIESNTRAQS